LTVFDLVNAVAGILKRYNDRTDVREIQADPFTVSEKIDQLRQRVLTTPRFLFSELFAAAQTRAEVVVTFLALLELIRMKLLVAVQSEQFGEIEIELAPVAPANPASADASPASSEGVGHAPPEIPGATPPADIVDPSFPWHRMSSTRPRRWPQKIIVPRPPEPWS
jgi:segregation and condensation protein A